MRNNGPCVTVVTGALSPERRFPTLREVLGHETR